MSGESFLLLEEAIIILLLIASVVAIMAKRFKIPYTVGLVLMGLVLGLLSARKFDISPQLILALLVPPLVFDAAFHIRLTDLRRDIWLILLLAVPGVILTTLMAGWLVAFGTGMSLSIALVFGALVSATDPVAVVALFRRLGVPRRLQVLLEGESLFNDGTAIVMFSLTVSTVLSGQFDLASNVASFLTVAGGGILVGITLGLLISAFIGRIDEPLVETTLTVILAFGSYLLAESFHVSGVLAVVAAGLVNGNAGPHGMSPTTRIVVYNFWETGAFLANSFVFLLVGFAVDVSQLIANWAAIGWAILAVLLARAVAIYGFSVFSRQIPLNWKHILYWGGLRGAIALALALSLPVQGAFAAERAQLQAMAFGVVLFTLLVQGFSMGALTRRLKIVERSSVQEEYERRHARSVAGRAAYDYVRRMSSQGLISEHTWSRLAPLMERQNAGLVAAIREVIIADPVVEAEELDTARREALRAQRTALTGLLHDNVISEETYSQLVGEVDAALTEEHLPWPELLRSGEAASLPVDRLMAVVIREQDRENVLSALTHIGFAVDTLPSVGGFLGSRNVTLVVGLPAGREDAALRAIKRAARGKVEFTDAVLPRADVPMPQPVPVQVGGATIFMFDVDSYEEF
ncbi:MAG: Na+/H+ antiporter [Anaerolineae bacterium]